MKKRELVQSLALYGLIAVLVGTAVALTGLLGGLKPTAGFASEGGGGGDG